MGLQNWQRDQGVGKTQSSNQVKSGVGKVLRLMYKPRISRSFGEIGRSNGIFVRLIAGVFASQGLFPAHHPALRDETIRLTLGEVITFAFQNLNWSKEGLPQIAFFFAVVGTMFFTALAAVIAMLGLLTTKAHAQGIFNSPTPLTDVANLWLEHIFNDDDFVFINSTTGDPYGMLRADTVSMPRVLNALAGMYSNCMLVVAAIILIYQLVSMIAHTAHDGVAMGRNAHQVWAPIRLVFALGLLVPVAGGWSSGQWLVMQIAKLGSGMASNIMWTLTSVYPPYIVTMHPDVRGEGLIDGLAKIGGCIMNTAYNVGGDPQATVLGALPTAVDIGTRAAPNMFVVVPASLSANSGFNTTNPSAPNETFVAGKPPDQWWSGTGCGSVFTPGMNTSSGATALGTFGNTLSGAAGVDAFNLAGVTDAYIDAYDAIADDALQFGATMAAGSFRPDGFDGLCGTNPLCDGTGAPDVQGSFAALSDTFQNQFLSSLGAAVVPLGSPPVEPAPGSFVFDENTNLLSYKSADGYLPDVRGWMVLGTYFMDIAAKGSLGEKLSGLNVQAGSQPQENNSAEQSMLNNATAIAQAFQNNNSASNQTACTSNLNRPNVSEFTKIIECIAFIPFGLMDENHEMMTGRAFAGSGDHLPFSDMVGFGERLVNGALSLIKIGIAINAAAAIANLAESATRGNGVKEGKIQEILRMAGMTGLVSLVSGLAGIASLLAPVLISFGVMMFIPGFLLFYILPVIPFINFVLGCITWLVSVLQGVIAIPVIAIAHITPNGEGLPSQSARGAYTMLLQIFLRPVMMVFGFFVCVLLINTGLVFASMLYSDSTNISMAGSGPMDQLIGFALYAGLCWGIVHAAITCIDEFPMKSVSWIGGGTVDANHPHQNSIAAVMAGTSVMNQVSSTLQGLRMPHHGKGVPLTRQQVAAQAMSTRSTP